MIFIFNVNDIVRIFDGTNLTYYIVVGFDEWEEECELKRIFPLYLNSQTIKRNLYEDEMVFVASIKDTREIWMEEMNNFKRASIINKKKFHGEKEWRDVLDNADDVNYEYIYSVDQCLDALNDLDALYKQFKDEEYLLHRETVIEQLKFLRTVEKKN